MLPLKYALRDHYGAAELDSRQLRELRDLLHPRPPADSRRNLLLAVAATLVLALGGMLTWHRLSQPSMSLPLRIAEEVALNHLALKPLDVQDDNLASLRPAFSRLDFSLIDSPRLAQQSWTLQGGRYCSVQSVPAAQLRYRDSADRPVTVYQAPYEPRRHGALPVRERGEPPMSLHVRGVEVTLWVERGLLMATAAFISGAANDTP